MSNDLILNSLMTDKIDLTLGKKNNNEICII